MLKSLILLITAIGLFGAFTFASLEGTTNPQVIMETSLGSIVLELNEAKAPGTVANFLGYVDDGFYDGTIFHRVIPQFMIQGGGHTPDFHEKATKAPIQNEADNQLKNDRGTIAMARTMDPHSATGQFFINHVDNDGLNHTAKTEDGWGYCVFGKVIEGMDVVDAIAAVKTMTKRGMQNVPRDNILIISAKRK